MVSCVLPFGMGQSRRRRSSRDARARAMRGGGSGVHTTPNPKVRKSGAVAKAVLASMVLEQGSIGVARGDSRIIRRIKERELLRGMPALLFTIRFCHTHGKKFASFYIFTIITTENPTGSCQVRKAA